MDNMTDAAMPPGFDPRTTMVPATWPLPWDTWLHLTQSAFDAWMGLWAAALPQRQGELVLQVQRQALDAWTAPLAWAAAPPEPQAQPAPRPPMPAVPMARPAETPWPKTAVPATPEPETPKPEMPKPKMHTPEAPEAEVRVSAKPVSVAQPESVPSRPRKAAKPAADLRQSRSRERLPPPRGKRPKTRR